MNAISFFFLSVLHVYIYIAKRVGVASCAYSWERCQT